VQPPTPSSDYREPAQRVAAEAIDRQAQEVRTQATIVAMLAAFPGPAAVLNDRRQIVAANAAFADAAVSGIQGQRPGEALGCVEAVRGCDGCGTAEACRQCGAGRGLSRLELGAPSPLREECLITRTGPRGEESLEYEAGISSLPGGWTLLAMRDISGEKRRRVLERCFIHDAINAAGAVHGLASLAANGMGEDPALLAGAADALIEELRHQQLLLAAESGDLQVRRLPVDLRELCAEVVRRLAFHPAAAGRGLAVLPGDAMVRTDAVLLRRVLINLLKNALEAIGEGCGVTLAVQPQSDGSARIEVCNPGEMPPAVLLQLFRRSFSTKAASGRGIGTWSVKLLTERYLGGTVSCTSAGGSTRFAVVLPPR
jgi:hypothetical protein